MRVSTEPRHVGPIEGREVLRGGAAPAPPDAAPAASDAGAASTTPAASGAGAPGSAVVPASAEQLTLRGTWQDIRRSRGKDVANSRPLPPWVRRFSYVLDDAFAVPGLPGRRVGLDGVISIVPVAGDAVGVVLSLVIVVVGVAAGVSVPTIVRMLLHVGLEALIGVVPVVGVVFNMAFKANNRNVALIERDLADRRATRRSSLAVLVLAVVVLVVGALMLIALTVAGLLVLVWLVSRWF